MITLTKQEAQQMYEVPLIEQLESVPKDARLRIDDADGMGTHYFPIGSMCHEAAKALRAKLSEPEPEPIGYLDKNWHFWHSVHIGEVDEPDKLNLTPLYTAPPQRDKGQKCHLD
jgi:hypothetical protein